MLSGLVHQAKATASRIARKAVLGGGAAICLLIGAGFLTLAGWIFLLNVTTALNAALIIGGLYTGTGFLLIAAVSVAGDKTVKTKVEPKAPPQPEADLNRIIAAFLSGLTAGRKARS